MNLITNFSGNSIKIHGVMANNYYYSHKILSCLKVNYFEESVENWSVDRLTIAGVLFGGLKEIKMKIQFTN